MLHKRENGKFELLRALCSYVFFTLRVECTLLPGSRSLAGAWLCLGRAAACSGCVLDISKRLRHLLAVVVPFGELQGWI